MDHIHALVHTQGVVVTNKYIVLEFAYRDVTGVVEHCLVKSPLSFRDAKRKDFRIRPDVIMTNEHGVPYASVLNFVCNQYYRLRNVLRVENVVFGFKGNSYQPKILRDAGLSSIVNIEDLGGIPSLKTLTLEGNGGCPFHARNSLKCAKRATDFIWNVLQQQKILSLQ